MGKEGGERKKDREEGKERGRKVEPGKKEEENFVQASFSLAPRECS